MNDATTFKKMQITFGWKKSLTLLLIFIFVAISSIVIWRYQTRYANDDPVIKIPLKEYTTHEYPADPAPLSRLYKRYSDRDLVIEKVGDNTFNFSLENNNKDTARIVFKDIDLSLFVPRVPEFAKDYDGLRLISLVDREWNRQQVSFKPDSPHIDIIGGDGVEKEHMMELALARNCLNAGLWEVILTINENGHKKMYYQGWFDFPMAHYKNVFESVNGFSWWESWYHLDHWFDPEGTKMEMGALREVVSEKAINSKFLADEPILTGGEQARKIRTANIRNMRTWGDFFDPEKNENVSFSSFLPPGQYRHEVPWNHKYWRLEEFTGTVLRQIKSPASADKILHELELSFNDKRNNEENRIIIGGLDVYDLPILPTDSFNKGIYKPMGIGVGPFYQSYNDLKQAPPHLSSYYSFILNENDEWLDHHTIAVDGPVMYRDEHNPNLIHLYLLSYERHSLVGHFEIELPDGKASHMIREVSHFDGDL